MLTYYAAYIGFVLLFSTLPHGKSNGFDLTGGLVMGSIFFVFIVGFFRGDSIESAKRHENQKNKQIDDLKLQLRELAEKK